MWSSRCVSLNFQFEFGFVFSRFSKAERHYDSLRQIYRCNCYVPSEAACAINVRGKFCFAGGRIHRLRCETHCEIGTGRDIYGRILNQEGKEGRYSSIIHIAKAYALIGKKEQALKYLELACQQRSAEICWIKTASELNTLRSDPRFSDLLRRIGLPG